jgi:hypothetical protein
MVTETVTETEKAMVTRLVMAAIQDSVKKRLRGEGYSKGEGGAWREEESSFDI